MKFSRLANLLPANLTGDAARMTPPPPEAESAEDTERREKMQYIEAQTEVLEAVERDGIYWPD